MLAGVRSKDDQTKCGALVPRGGGGEGSGLRTDTLSH